jgi:NSS family neurotransmitter:Na+ symporter
LHGGGTFLLVYIPSLLIIAVPVMIAELMIGRSGGSNPVHGLALLAKRERLSSLWQITGWLALLAGFLVFSYYSVVASWILFYIMESVTGSFVDVPAEIVQHSFSALLRNTDQLIIWHTVFVLMVVQILSRSVRVGLERALTILMPCFVALLCCTFYFALQVGDIDSALEFMLSYDISKINTELIVSASTQALFSLSIGLGILLMYGAYLGEKRPIATATAVIVLFDTALALLMAFLIFSVVFAFGMEADSGAGLIFETLPVAFSNMASNSVLWATLFFSLLGVAALTSAIALLEPIIAWMISQFMISRRMAAWCIGSLAWATGFISIYSFSDLRYSFYYFGTERFNGTFDFLNIFTTQMLMPLIALLLTVLAGWRINSKVSRAELAIPLDFVYKIWQFSVRWVTPLLLFIILALVLFVPQT